MQAVRPAPVRGLEVGGQPHGVPPIVIQTLGSFRVLREGVAVPQAEWRSKKARDLLKMLVARVGRPVPRDTLIDHLWPEEDSGRLPHRLSVAITTVRRVLDPGKRFAPDHYIRADARSLCLEVANLEVDVDLFLTQARAGLKLVREEGAEAARLVLEAAEAIYAGEFLEDDLYEEWAVLLREEARAVFVGVARHLARGLEASGDSEGAARCHLRILERDAYDEEAHLRLVAILRGARRHGEAQRRYQAYVALMEEIDVAPAPFPMETFVVRVFVGGDGAFAERVPLLRGIVEQVRCGRAAPFRGIHELFALRDGVPKHHGNGDATSVRPIRRVDKER